MSLRIEMTRADVDQLVASHIVVTEDLISQQRFTPAGGNERDFLPVDLLYGPVHWAHSTEAADVLAAFTGGTIYSDDAENQLPLVMAVPASAFPGESCTLHPPLPRQDGLAAEAPFTGRGLLGSADGHRAGSWIAAADGATPRHPECKACDGME